jgi:hypothetical protein
MILTRETVEAVDGKVFFEVQPTWFGKILHKCGLDVLMPRRIYRMDFNSRTGPVLTVGAHCSVRIVGNVTGSDSDGFAVENAGDLEIVGNVLKE